MMARIRHGIEAFIDLQPVADNNRTNHVQNASKLYKSQFHFDPAKSR